MKISMQFILLSFSLLASSYVSARGIPENVNLAAKAMYAAARMMPDNDKSNKYQSNGSHACKTMQGKVCEAWYKDFKEDLNYYVSVHNKIMYIAFRGTWGKSNDDMNDDGRVLLKHAHSVHRGWWNAKNKAWKKIRPYVVKYGKGRKIIVTGQSMGGAMAAYITKTMLHDNKTKKFQIRLVTFGAPRYTLSYNFFPSKKNFYVYTLENLYWNGKKWKTDEVVFDWERGLRNSGNILYKKADLKRPKDKRVRTWTVKCKTNAKNQEQVHDSTMYYNVGSSASCDT